MVVQRAKSHEPVDERQAEEARPGIAHADLARIAEAETVVEVPPVSAEEWETWAPGDLNAYLRAILRRIELGPDLRPVGAVWRNPALRS